MSKVEKFTGNKKINSQEDMSKVLTIKTMNVFMDIAKETELPENGLTAYLAEVGCNNKVYDVTICFTPKGVLEEFANSMNDFESAKNINELFKN
jgi:hypothetical protein